MTETLLSGSEQKNTLSIRLSVDGFCFISTFPGHDDRSVEYSVNRQLPMAANFKQAQRQFDWLQDSYDSVNVVLCTRRFTLVPLELFDDEQCEPLFHQAQSFRDNEFIRYNVLSRSGLVVVFGIDKALLDLLEKSYPSLHISTQLGILAEHFFVKYRFAPGRKLFVNISHSHLLLVAIDRRQVLIANTLECEQLSDRLYVILNVWKQVGMSQEDDELILGDTDEKSGDMIQELKRFIRHVSLMEPPRHYDLLVALNE